MNAWPRKNIVESFEFASLKPHAVRAVFRLCPVSPKFRVKESPVGGRFECVAKFDNELEAKLYFRELLANFGLPSELKTFVGPPNRESVSICFWTRSAENSDIIFLELVLKKGLVDGIWKLVAGWRFGCGGKLREYYVQWWFGGTDELGLALEKFQKLESRLGTPQHVWLLGFS